MKASPSLQGTRWYKTHRTPNTRSLHYIQFAVLSSYLFLVRTLCCLCIFVIYCIQLNILISTLFIRRAIAKYCSGRCQFLKSKNICVILESDLTIYTYLYPKRLPIYYTDEDFGEWNPHDITSQ